MIHCACCGREGGSFATLPRYGILLFCTGCRRHLFYQGWEEPDQYDALANQEREADKEEMMA